MESLKQEQVRSMIRNFVMVNWTKGTVHTVKHFKAMGIAQETIYRVLRSVWGKTPKALEYIAKWR